MESLEAKRTHAGLQEGVTDSSFQALAEARCVHMLTALRLSSESESECVCACVCVRARMFVFLFVCVSVPAFFISAKKGLSPWRVKNGICAPALHDGVTDASFQALAEAGCGRNLMSLSLWGA